MLQRLIQARGPSGDEGEVRAIVKEFAAPYADEIIVDALGSVIVRVDGTDKDAPTVMVCAHMDEVGLIITAVQDNGLLRYECIGGIDPVVMVSKRVKVGKKGVPGVIGSKAIHLQEPTERQNPFKHKDLYIDIGAKDKADALSMVSVGDYATFDGEVVRFGDGLIKSRALDDRVGCYVMTQLLTKKQPSTVYYVFAVQEEIGCRGAAAAANRIQPDIGIVLEGTTASDVGDAKEHEEVCCVGKGPTISFMDSASIAHYPLMMALREAGDRNNIPWQIKRFSSGGNDAGAIQTAGAGSKTCVISVPCRYIHSPSSACSLKDIDSAVALVDAFLRTGARV